MQRHLCRTVQLWRAVSRVGVTSRHFTFDQPPLCAMGTVTPDEIAPQPSGEAPESTDFANYFCTYAYLYHQKDMLEDRKRTGSYYEAVMKNQNLFKNRVVLDVGTGSGILAVFAAKAGAKKVYAVEATDMARHARTLATANKFDDRIVVIQGTMESIELPEKVDIIISEWMGFFLLRESMLDTVLLARDKFLKPGGSLFPSHANMYLAPIRTQDAYRRQQEYQKAMASWHACVSEMREYYGVNMHCLTKQYDKEQRDYYEGTAQWSEIHPQQLVSPAVCFKSYDLLTVTIEELKAPLEAKIEFQPRADGVIEGLCGFFDVTFAGSPQNPAQHPIVLSTAPEIGPCTHWGQLSFFLLPHVPCQSFKRLPLTLKISRREDNHRLMNLHVEFINDHPENIKKYDFFIE